MNLLVAYAKVPMSFLSLYRRREAHGKYVVAIACAMTGILVVNVWSGLLLFVCVTHTSLIGMRVVQPDIYSLILAAIFIFELAFVHFVQKKVERDRSFASQVGNTSPRISIWYAGVSAGLLLAATIAMVVTT
jgi:hypothetical protein